MRLRQFVPAALLVAAVACDDDQPRVYTVLAQKSGTSTAPVYTIDPPTHRGTRQVIRLSSDRVRAGDTIFVRSVVKPKGNDIIVVAASINGLAFPTSELGRDAYPVKTLLGNGPFRIVPGDSIVQSGGVVVTATTGVFELPVVHLFDPAVVVRVPVVVGP